MGCTVFCKLQKCSSSCWTIRTFFFYIFIFFFDILDWRAKPFCRSGWIVLVQVVMKERRQWMPRPSASTERRPKCTNALIVVTPVLNAQIFLSITELTLGRNLMLAVFVLIKLVLVETWRNIIEYISNIWLDSYNTNNPQKINELIN